MNELNTRQWTLYNYLKERGDNWTSLKQIAHDLNYGEVKPNQTFNNSLARRTITKDRQAINNSDVIQKIIICGNRGLKLANKEEAEDYLERDKTSLLKALARHYKLEKKAGMDGQLRGVFGAEREIIHAFIDSNLTGDKLKAIRQEKHLTQPAVVKLLSQYIKIDVPMLSRLENGVYSPTNEQIEAFKKVYNASI